MRGFRSSNRPDPHAVRSLKLAAQAGFGRRKHGVYLYPSARCGDAKGQVDRVTLNDDGVELVNARTGDAPPPRVAVALAPAAMDGFVGRYELRPGFVLELTRDGDKMFGQATGQPKFALMPVSATTFYVKEVDAEIVFDNGNSQLTLLQGGRKLPGKRL